MTTPPTPPETILHWIRAVALADLPMATRGLALLLVTLVDNTTMVAPHSIRQAAGRWQISTGTCKRHKAALCSAGLLAPGQGWHLATPTDSTADHTTQTMQTTEHLSGIKIDTPPGSILITEQPSGIKIDTPPGSNMSLYNHHRSTLTNYPNNNSNTDGVEGGSNMIPEKNSRPTAPPTLADLPKAIRPNVGQRTPQGQHWLHWHDQWERAAGKPWPWPVWAQAVLPYLTDEERAELLGAALSTPRLNLGYCNAVASRLCQGQRRKATRGPVRAGAVPTVVQGRSADDDDFLAALGGH